MKIAIMQPTFLPWLGYFKMMQSVDSFVFLDNVCFQTRSWQSRNKIKLNDKEFLFSLHCSKASQNTLIQDILLLDEVKWKENLLKTFSFAYKKSANFSLLYECLQKALFTEKKLSDINTHLISEICKMLEIHTPLQRASELGIDSGFKKEALLLEICKHKKALIYLSAQGSREYLEDEKALNLFAQGGVEIRYFDFWHPVYQQFGTGFISHLSIIDYLACVSRHKWGEFLKTK